MDELIFSKTCPTCRRTRPLSNFYRRSGLGNVRYRSECKDCEHERLKRWLSKPKNRKKKNDSIRRYYYAHHEQSKAERRAYNRDYYLRNKRKLYLKQRAYAQTRRGKAIKNEALRRYRARLRGSTRTDEVLSVEDWNRLLVEFGGACAWCRAPFSRTRRPEQDHVIPVSKGGSHTVGNVVPACRSCNARGGNKNRQFPAPSPTGTTHERLFQHFESIHRVN